MKLKQPAIKTGVSNRHLHLSAADIESLFGKGHELTPVKDLGQPGQFACDEKVILVGPKGAITGVRVLGPARKATQIEVSRTDSFTLGIKPPIKDSGDHTDTPGLTIVGPKGTVVLNSGVMLAKRHIHMTPADAEIFGVEDKDIVMVYAEGAGTRKVVFDDVLVRVHSSYALEFHVDVDEANAAVLNNDDPVYIVEEL
ncbi:MULTISPECIES: phosphate propanoyltransferase [Mesotoga]|uniref:phosphate propanoyltransferase n=1 Tax=Mesotoga TaxID=1184396 RepID=UPI0002CB8D18|nr:MULTISPECIES: phosphate propanoyltransferase [Mesotoga]MCP5456866.1 phosphate propanoyltransferase [Thermotogota bacterium]CCU86038.1 Phosphate propanoyltransferase [Mesotoga infera]MCB1223071.1 phosphate propanoyltransferase [Mesotoga sp.]MCP5461043.1 phosphate propanoyltransferase [Thermotogota bacterium]HNQ70042.1 phosphate propanoyltransferase [Mesotoga prima]